MTTELRTIIDEVLEVLEARIPANPMSNTNKKLPDPLEAELKRYFNQISAAMPYQDLVRIYSKHAPQEGKWSVTEADGSLEDEIDEFLDPIVQTFRGSLRTNLAGHLARVYLRGDVQVFEWARTKITNRPIYYEGPPIKAAMKYAEERCAELITKMEDETKQRIAQVISDGIENKRGIDGLARDIKAECASMGYEPMGTSRAEMIARTETTDALEQAFMDRATDLGVTGKDWVVTDPCEICEENGAAGTIGINEEFPSGHLRPPAHPNCRCALAPVMLSTKESAILEAPPVGHEPYNPNKDEKGRWSSGGGSDTTPKPTVRAKAGPKVGPPKEVDIDREHDIYTSRLSQTDLQIQDDVYGGTGAYRMYEDLRAGRESIYTENVKEFDKMAMPAVRDTQVYRGMILNESYAAELRKGAVLKDKAFVSTSLDKVNASEYMQSSQRRQTALFEITILKGSPIIPIRNRQHELVLPRDSRLKITSVSVENTENNWRSRYSKDPAQIFHVKAEVQRGK